MTARSRITELGQRVATRLSLGRLPLAWTLRDYPRSALRGDLVAGVTVAALIIPLSIGYAQVAGLPPVAGLYASLVPLFAYAVFGSGRRLIIGPDAATAALVGAAVIPLAVSADDRLRLASALALLVAVLFIGMRLASLGVLADLLSRPILVGYMTGVGISVAIGQIPKILGASPIADAIGVLTGTDPMGVGLGTLLQAMATAILASGVVWPSVVLGGLVLVVVLLGDRLLPGVPVALPALVGALIATVVLDLGLRGVAVLGPVPSGLPPIGLPLVSPEEAIALLPAAVGIAILSFADTALTGRSFAEKHREETEPDRELIALAAADLGTSLTSGYPISASPSRTAAAEASGGTTQLTGIVAALAVMAVLVFLAGFLEELPIPALGAIVLAAALRYIDLPGIVRIWRIERIEGAIAIAAMVGVLLYGTLFGVAIATLLAALNVFGRAARPRIDELGRLPGTSTYVDLDRHPAAERLPGLTIARPSGPLFFATATGFRHRIAALAAERTDVRYVVVDASGIVDLDLTAAAMLRTLRRDLGDRGVELVMARPTGRLRDLLRLHDLGELAGSEDEAPRTLDDVIDAVAEAGRSAALEPGPAPVPESAGEAPAPPPSLERRWSAAIVVIGVVVIVSTLGVALALGDRGSDAAAGAEVVAPDIVGSPLRQAQADVERVGLVLGAPVFVESSGLPEGTVTAQSPEAGATMTTGQAIEPTVSTRLGVVKVPDVAGSSEADAIVTITKAGLRVGDVIAASDPGAIPGSVVATDPAAGTEVALRTVVTLRVARDETSPSVAH